MFSADSLGLLPSRAAERMRTNSGVSKLRLLSLVPALAALPPLPRAALFGFVEMTNGVNALPATRTGFVLCAAIMNWGGLSVQAQTCAMLAGSALSARRCVIGKAVQALAGVPLALLAAQRLF